MTMNSIWIITLIFTYTLLSVSALPSYSATRQCKKFESRKSVAKQEILEDNSISSNEYQDEAESDYNDVYGDQNNNTNIEQATNVSCSVSKNFCFSAWKIQSDGSMRVESQGCWEHSERCNQASCMGYEEKRTIIFCCCNADYCNSNLIQPTPITSPVVVSPNGEMKSVEKISFKNSAMWISFASTGIMLIIIAVVFFISCRDKSKPLQETSPLAPSGPGYSSNLYNVDNLKPISIIGEGKYGTVWKGMINEQPVAIKIFSAAKKQYFLNEVDIYVQPFMDSCPALLTYFGCDERLNSDGKLEYLLVLSLAELGSLQDYLRSNATTFQIFSRMAMSIARGLSHLHTRIQKADMIKMCICHRDLNSRNILVKADLSCCLCDFGFGTKLNGSRYEYQGEMILAETKSIYEVGTMRYMAPEILEGAVNLRDCETSLKQIDVYSLGLVLWELCMRCHDFYPPEMPTPPYKAPYEAEIGIHPTFDQMRALVLQHKARPLFPPQWGGGTAAIAAKEVCEDCWDPDAEARLTSLCAEERLIEIATLKPRSHYVTLSTPLSTNNKLVSSPTREQHAMMIPPNQIIVHNEDSLSSPSAEYGVQKNREMYAQQIQPFQGRNLCLERNLVQVHQADQSSDEKLIKKCPLSNGNQLLNTTATNENFHAEYEVLVEELLSRKLASSSSSTATMQTPREILPKKNNSDKKSSRWREIIHSKFQMKRKHQSLNVDNISQSFSSPVKSQKHVDVIESKPNNVIQERPRNLDIASPITMNNSSSYKTLLNNPNNDTFAIVHEPSKIVTSKSATLSGECSENSVLKRQRSLEVFREVFGPSKMNLSNVQCRVKTPGDLPASVRKVRASKTLSLYDDRIMDPTEKFIRDNNSL